jgi:hypothetical protein
MGGEASLVAFQFMNANSKNDIQATNSFQYNLSESRLKLMHSLFNLTSNPFTE